MLLRHVIVTALKDLRLTLRQTYARDRGLGGSYCRSANPARRERSRSPAPDRAAGGHDRHYARGRGAAHPSRRPATAPRCDHRFADAGSSGHRFAVGEPRANPAPPLVAVRALSDDPFRREPQCLYPPGECRGVVKCLAPPDSARDAQLDGLLQELARETDPHNRRLLRSQVSEATGRPWWAWGRSRGSWR